MPEPARAETSQRVPTADAAAHSPPSVTPRVYVTVMGMAVTVEDQHERAESWTDQEIEAVLNAMETAAPGSRAEFMGGSYSLNRPRAHHQRSIGRLYMALMQSIPHHLEALVEVRVHHGRTWIVPDIIVVPKTMLEDDLSIVDAADVVLLIEILSPSTRVKDAGPKKEFCRGHGIDYCMVEPGDPWGEVTVHDFGDGGLEVPETE